MKKIVLCLFALLVLNGCDLEESDRRNNERLDVSINIDRVDDLGGGLKKTQITLAMGANDGAYVDVSYNGYVFSAREYLTANQIASPYKKRLVCDTKSVGGYVIGQIRCAWTQYNPQTGTWSGALGEDWGNVSWRDIDSNIPLKIVVRIGGENGVFHLYINGDRELY
ncbi:MAG: hypothetical protein LBT81_01070 [Helicobacteraceae bacterium]|jgi:hypothetical protein|nr:hypothetical protein [Helicobacteraceae bacterium]